MKNYGTLIAKALGILASGFVLSLSRDKEQRFKLHRECDRLWNTIDRKQLYHVLRSLKLNGFVETIKKSQNVEKIYLNEKGKNKWLQCQLRNLKTRKAKTWDKKWRIVLFDIPESKRKIRDALRKKLKNLGFLEFQKSVFIYPYPARDEINFIINYFNIEDNVYYLEAPISPDYNFRKHFNLK
ncbi:MAG: CRISPR-associated endonuclease Cas2 [Candidatus Tagabacteria bacterium CG_4_10_14_0_2_um_filter_40_13]|uniref:CRISPR-associated endonuclease Cas2 n=3 Tax=Candidatus Tagaibacteriota TaxID=1817918 RepID=A0A2M8G932_9BACT|nr:MAG: CRISPR-associated endonuclease Cas2 [Candidatus Tagabacteria bacterium CG11_big_fil_rev_8_21_14_0_20_41_11]PIU99436.1 MAG: CRISPR-associated endonuclease Cas2 [Candidatus Tagabacteria bacterium CG03_land_8_20_14_0_80_41_22]PIZ56363.1 MAG: CRISPR-associated endonuclease Cas2 [Candidatus Tagabacteria bacterium CG_4_10_14_0_2_um_filter_40_13]PJC25422.1 MAG: CRISPR-associated endonuclease Cas2 [Candidatus Tagabacteria bacterium CG_4_9_14_0_2_um_filter_41_11]PJC69946.1 MAG: CRISPR-associated